MEKILLPPKYYLDHFEELILEIFRHHTQFMAPAHQDFLKDYQSLAEDSKCLFIRMVNRSGHIFQKNDFVYPEIVEKEKGWDELMHKGFIRALNQADWEDYVGWLKKEPLKKLLEKNVIVYKKSASREELIALAMNQSHPWSPDEQIVVLNRREELQYLLFLYFGKLQPKLILHTLRDLGIRQSHKKTVFKAKFKDQAEALNHYFYCVLEQELHSYSISDIATWPHAQLLETKIIRENILSSSARNASDIEALEILKLCQFHPATEKRARLYYQLELKDECLRELERMMDDPLNDEELLFAEDFLQRKFQKKKMSTLTETLRNSEKLAIDESFYRKPEMGVLNHFKTQGHQGHFSENGLWIQLFWMFFDEELKSNMHSEFDFVSSELKEKTFHLKNEQLIKTKLEAVTQFEDLLTIIRKFHEDDSEEYLMFKDFLTHAPLTGVMSMLIYLAEDFDNRSTGFPDIFIVKNERIQFYEIKAEGDSLKSSQLKQMRQLEKLGFEVKILQTLYQFNPDQVYVVVDLETTGSLSSWNRITEIGAVKLKGNEVIETFQTLINPQRSIPQNIQGLTGITNEMVRSAPKFSDVALSFKEFIKDTIFVAHNAGFDYGFLQNEFKRLDERFVMPYICTKSWSKKHFPGLHSYGLKNLCIHFNISLESHHRALCDAQAAAGLLIIINTKRSAHESHSFKNS